MTGSKIAQMFHVMATPLLTSSFAGGWWRQINVSNFTFLSADQHPSSLPKPRGRAGRGPGSRAILFRAYLTPSYLFILLRIRPLLPGHASRVAGVFYG
jgi:hypothetical protein